MMDNLQKKPFENLRLWHSRTKRQRVPEFEPHLPTTPGFEFGQDKWLLPREFFAAGHRSQEELDFLAPIFIPGGGQLSLNHRKDRKLIDQLKKCLYITIFHIEFLSRFRVNKVPSGSTIYKALSELRRIFVTFKFLGANDLSEVTHEKIGKCLEMLDQGTQYNTYPLRMLDLITICKHGLITSGIPDTDYFVKLATIVEQVEHLGPPPLSYEDVGSALATSRYYIDNRSELYSKISNIIQGSESKRDVIDWARATLPCGDNFPDTSVIYNLSSLIQIPSLNFIGYHFGPRISEILSIREGFVGIHSGENVVFTDRITVEMTTFKGNSLLHGTRRYFPTHPYILEVGDALHELKRTVKLDGPDLFVSPLMGRVYQVSHVNQLLQRYFDWHDIDTNVSSHVWRNTLAAVSVETTVNPLPYLRELFGHKDVNQTARYAACSPWLNTEVRNRAKKHLRETTETILSQTKAAGGRGIGGGNADVIEKMMLEAINGQPDASAKSAVTEVAEELEGVGVIPRRINQTDFCLKNLATPGRCGKNQANIARCVQGCGSRIQTSPAVDAIETQIRGMRERLQSPEYELHENVLWAMELKTRASAWPDMADLLSEILEANPDLQFWFT
jgi:integrase